MSPVLRGALLMAAAATFVSVDTIIIRIVSAEIHPFEIAFFRNLFSLLVLAPWMMRVGVSGLKSPRMPMHVLRALIKLAAIISFFYAVKLLPLAAVTAIAFTAPLFVALGSMAFLGEPVHVRRLAALFVGFCGVLVIVRPGSAVFDPLILLALAAAFGLGAIGIMMKYLAMRENPPAIVSLNLLISVPAALVIAVPVWMTPSPEILALLVVQGLLGGMSQLCFSRAMSIADASVVMPIEFIRLPLVVVLAYLMFGELTDIWTVVGGAVIFAATIALVRREGKVLPNAAGLPS
jgi:drug/metabolite transporter (DMT)-like permease